MNNIYLKLIEYIQDDEDALDILLNADKLCTKKEVIDFLEQSKVGVFFSSPIVSNYILTEGNIFTTLKLINDLSLYNGDYILFINKDNAATNTYFVKRANDIFKELGLNVTITIDYSDNYNRYINYPVTLIGSQNYILTVKEDFPYGNYIFE